MDTVTITPYKEGMDTEQTKREMDVHADGYKQGYEDAVQVACEWLTERTAFGVHPCSGTGLVMEFKEFMKK